MNQIYIEVIEYWFTYSLILLHSFFKYLLLFKNKVLFHTCVFLCDMFVCRHVCICVLVWNGKYKGQRDNFLSLKRIRYYCLLIIRSGWQVLGIPREDTKKRVKNSDTVLKMKIWMFSSWLFQYLISDEVKRVKIPCISHQEGTLQCYSFKDTSKTITRNLDAIDF